MRLERLTITGVNEKITPGRLADLWREFPFLEWGVLQSQSREGGEPRYPRPWWVEHLCELAPPEMPLAAHLCGSWAREAVGGPFLWPVERRTLFERCQRIQINGQGNDINTYDRLVSYQQRLGKEWIIQCEKFPLSYSGKEGAEHRPSWLLDASGGRGQTIREFPVVPHGWHCGYAGGIGPDNIREVLTKLCAIESDAGFWVDMESGVRTDDWLDLDKVRAVCEVAAEFRGRK